MKIIGHRGAAAYAPENTLRSVEVALRLGVDYVEVDVRATADGKLVLMHDRRLDRTTTGTGILAELPWSVVRNAREKQDQQPIPQLEEVLELVAGRAPLMLELKDPWAVKPLIRTLRASAALPHTLLASFHHGALRQAQQWAPELQTLALLEGVPVHPSAFAREAGSRFVGVCLEALTEEFVAELKAAALTVFVYTVNDPRDAAWLDAIGADGIISDQPDVVRIRK